MGTGTWVWCQKLEIRDAAQTTCLDDSFSYLDIGLWGFKDVLTIDAANHNVVDSCGTLVSCCAWHSK